MIYGDMLYCDCLPGFKDGCTTVEIAIIDNTGNLVPFKNGDTVKGHTKPDELPAIMMWIKNQTSETKEQTNADA